ncbi:MAG: FAD-binding oxidoreductase [Proteobacteria bacterium]|nr:FAD-binding oxidoreductase [Pseudomonadota bacterium]
MQFNSPWLQFNRQSWPNLKEDIECDVAIIGAGISGVSTLYFLLHHTDKKIVLLEKNHVASGATGHNAGFACAVMETSIQQLINQYGLEKTKRTYYELDRGWELLLEIYNKLDMQEDFVRINHTNPAYTSVDNLVYAVTQEMLQDQIGRRRGSFLIVDDEKIKEKIPDELRKYIQFVPQEKILKTLKTQDKAYIAVLVTMETAKTARINSAKFCYKVLLYLQKKFPERFFVYENTEITQIDIESSCAVLHHARGTIKTHDVILCTNAYKDFLISDKEQKCSVLKLHESLMIREGYLAAYTGDNSDAYGAAFFDHRGMYESSPYFYVIHTPPSVNEKAGLTILGGPEYYISEDCSADLIQQHAQESFEVGKRFLKNTFNISKDSFDYFWRGIMGYTKSGLRWVGQDPEYPHLWYNLGCNGVGILPAISGGEKIAQLMNGETLLSSLFDPPESIQCHE